MVNVKDRVPTYANRYTLTDGGTSKTVTLVRNDEPVEAGSLLGRQMLMAVQGFVSKTTVFNANGSITETNSNGDTLVTVFNANGSITETFTADGVTISKTTTFNNDGSISEVVTG